VYLTAEEQGPHYKASVGLYAGAMEFERWAPVYAEIARDFGFPFEREERSAARLRSLLPPEARDVPLERIRTRLADRDVVVVGAAPRAGPPPLWRLAASPRTVAVVVADAATKTCLDAGIVPALVATDLDGPVPPEISANRRGALVVVHAHGDNLEAVDEWVPQFPSELAGSWAGPPGDGLIDVGGFTDGDRAAFLAEAGGARSILLWGFDFANVEESDPSDGDRKRAKLRWAERALGILAREGRTPMQRWARDGSLAPYPPGSSDESTR
jgi:2-amino-4-hydroxy-6-hydroxymethyldihydropteridine diphosphokinase